MNVLIATHGRPELLKQSLDSLLLAASGGKITKIVLVENGGDFGAKAVAEQCDDSGLIAFTSIPEANKSLALNAGLSLCEDGLVFLTDDDVIIPPDLIDAYAKAAQSQGPGCFFGGPTQVSYEAEPASWLKRFLPVSAKGWSYGKPVLDDDDYFLGFNWAAYRSDLMQAGGFCEDFGPGSKTGATGQESEMQRRLRRVLGAKGIYLSDALVSHVVPAERCSREWVIKRVYRRAVEKGIWQMRDIPEIAKEDLRKKKKRAPWRRLAAAVLGGTERKFRSEFWDSWIKGFEHGITWAGEAKRLERYESTGR